jgi:hypothetical protein
LPVQLVSVSMKLRQMFYTQIERRTFHTAWNAGTHNPWRQLLQKASTTLRMTRVRAVWVPAFRRDDDLS